jgi:hypothetical protein
VLFRLQDLVVHLLVPGLVVGLGALEVDGDLAGGGARGGIECDAPGLQGEPTLDHMPRGLEGEGHLGRLRVEDEHMLLGLNGNGRKGGHQDDGEGDCGCAIQDH